MNISRFARFGALLAAFAFADATHALSTTYTWGSDQDVERFDGIYLSCINEPDMAAEFPELCGGPDSAILTVEALHDRPIWDNDASGCDPVESPLGCSYTDLHSAQLIVLSGVAEFDPSELSSFHGVDFLGTCPIEDCESAAPFIVFAAIDTLTGLALTVRDRDSLMVLELTFADGRSFVDNGTSYWGRGATVGVPEPGTLGLCLMGLVGLAGSVRRRG